MLPIPLSPQPLKILLFTVFSSIFPCANAGSQLQHIYKKSFQNIVFDSVFPMFPVKQTVIYTFFCHKGSKSFQNIAFDSVFVMFPVKHTVIYTFFAITSVQTLVFAVFSMLWHPKTLQNLAMYNVFFIFGRFSIAGKLPKWPKIPFQYPLALRHPKILKKCRKHHRILVSVRNRFWGLVSVRNRFWPPPPS